MKNNWHVFVYSSHSLTTDILQIADDSNLSNQHNFSLFLFHCFFFLIWTINAGVSNLKGEPKVRLSWEWGMVSSNNNNNNAYLQYSWLAAIYFSIKINIHIIESRIYELIQNVGRGGQIFHLKFSLILFWLLVNSFFFSFTFIVFHG